MKPTLKHHPKDYALRDLLVLYANGRPISCDQYNFLYRHEKTLTHHPFTYLKGYYLKDYYHKQAEQHSFLLPHEGLDAASVQQLKRRLRILLQGKNAFVQFKMTPEQFLKFRTITIDELILYHGNQFLTGAPFYQGGIPYVLYFQWGNLFGVAKYVVLAEEKALKSNILIYFQDMQERLLDDCVLDYQNKFREQLQMQNQHVPKMQPAPPTYVSHFATPTLTLSRNKEVEQQS